MKREFYTEQVFTRLTKKDDKAVRKLAKKRKQTRSELIRLAVYRELDEAK